jgi:hypothetical protein
MSQAALLVGFHLVGLAACLAFGPRRHPALTCALAFPVGLALVVLIALGLLVAGIPYRPATLGGAVTLAIAACLAVVRTRPPGRALRVTAAWWTAGVAAAAAALAAVNLVVMTHDSHTFVILGGVIARDGALAGDVFRQLDEWGVFTVVAQSIGGLAGLDFFPALPLALGLSFIPVFALTLHHGLAAGGAPDRRRVLVVGLVTVALFTNQMVAFHLAYLHSNLGSAIYLFGFVVGFWLCEVEGDPEGLPVAFLCLIALALQRTETPLVALLFAALTVPQSGLPRAALTRGLIAFTVVVAGWFELLAHHVDPETAFLTPTRCRIVEAALVVALGWWLVPDRPIVRRINRLLPVAIAGLAAIALAAAFALEGEHLGRSAARWSRALFTVPHWGAFWYVLAALLVIAIPAPPPRFRQAFVVGIPVFFGFVLLLSLGRDPYTVQVDDSANRMTIHVAPLLLWYAALKRIR